jgi:hypothetical protein
MTDDFGAAAETAGVFFRAQRRGEGLDAFGRHTAVQQYKSDLWTMGKCITHKRYCSSVRWLES